MKIPVLATRTCAQTTRFYAMVAGLATEQKFLSHTLKLSASNAH